MLVLLAAGAGAGAGVGVGVGVAVLDPFPEEVEVLAFVVFLVAVFVVVVVVAAVVGVGVGVEVVPDALDAVPGVRATVSALADAEGRPNFAVATRTPIPASPTKVLVALLTRQTPLREFG